MNITDILALKPSPEADRAFAEVLMGWRVSFCNLDLLRIEDGPMKGLGLSQWRPTTGNDGKGDPACWWLGVERLRELGCRVDVTAFPTAEVVRSPMDIVMVEVWGGGHVGTGKHPNPAIAVLRAGVQALQASTFAASTAKG